MMKISAKIAGKYARTPVAVANRYEYDDLRGAAIEGALRGHATFDRMKGAKWVTWVWQRAEYEVMHYVRDHSGLDRTAWQRREWQDDPTFATPVSLDQLRDVDNGDPGDQGGEVGFDPADPREDPEATVVLKDLVECLPAAHRAVIALRYAGLNTKQIAGRLRIRAGDADRLLEDSRKALSDSGRVTLPGDLAHFRALCKPQKPAPISPRSVPAGE